MTKRRAVFLDRDGVLNRAIVRDRKPYPPKNAGEVELVDGVEEAMRQLAEAGFVLLVVTNQPDVARGKASREDVEAINAWLGARLPIARFFTCWHDDAQDCDCRKPRPGLLLEGAREFDVDLPSSFMVGDRWRDVEAGAAAGCRTIFIDYGYDEKRPERCDARVSSTMEAAKAILRGVT